MVKKLVNIQNMVTGLDFADECLKVPIIFHSPQLKENCRGPCRLKGLSPTMSAPLASNQIIAWQGEDLTKKFKENQEFDL